MSKKTADEKRQRAELRVVRESADGYALLMFIRVHGRDIYAGLDKQTAESIRTSYHATGQRHVHTAVGRFSRHQSARPDAIDGYEVIWQTSTLTSDWTYAPKPDTERKRTLILRDSDYPDGACIMALAVEPDRPEIVAALETGTAFAQQGVEVVAHLIADWVAPTVMVVALRMRPEQVVAFRAAIERDGGDPSEHLNGFVIGPPAPNGIQWKILGRVAKDGTVTRFAELDS